jgi:glycosyltransferase involved in cell wall biosynthesis
MQRSPLKVLLLQDTTNYAGTEAHVLTLAKNLEEHTDVSPIVGVTKGGELEMRCAAGNISYRVLQKTRGIINLAGMVAVTKMLRKREVDVVHAHNGRTSLVAVCAKLFSRTGQVVVTQHFIEPDYVKRRGVAGRVSGLVHRLILSNVDQNVCISETVKSSFLGRQDQGVVNRACVHIVNNGVDDVYSTLSRDDFRKQVLSYLNVPANTKLILCVSRLEPEKDVQALLSSLTYIDKFLQYHCLIVGDGSERLKMESFVREAHIDDRVSFLGYRDDVPAMMKASDMFVLPCPAEGFGLVLAEAMLAGLPVVAINNGGPSEIIISGQTGYLVPKNDVAAMSLAIASLLENPAQCLSMGILGQNRAKTVYASSVMAINTRNVYALCGSKGQ